VGASEQAPSLSLKTLRSRGAAATQSFFLAAGGERRYIVPSLSVIGFGAPGRVFVFAARPLIARTIERLERLKCPAVGRACQR
jgi:hypothetical protein